MPIANEIFICDRTGGSGNYRLYAVLDELTLTYRVIQRAPDGDTHSMRQHIPSLREARRWACDQAAPVTGA